MSRDDGSLYEWEMVDYWLDEGGVDKLKSQYPRHFHDDRKLNRIYLRYLAIVQDMKERLEELVAEEYGEPIEQD